MHTEPRPVLLAALLAALVEGKPIHERVMIIVAHPDDETLGLGAQLHRMRNALLVHVTDGAPRDGDDARHHGFASVVDYAAARRRELAAALGAGGAQGLRQAELGIPDKEAMLDLAGLSRNVEAWLRRERPVAVFTHAYEGGHPDHDAAAFAVSTACARLPAVIRPAIVEMPFYHATEGCLTPGCFLPGGGPETIVALNDDDLECKQRMIACFRSQREMLSQFPLGPERFRLAPAHDFTRPPHSGVLLYETFGWSLTGAEWRRQAGAALAALGLAGVP